MARYTSVITPNFELNIYRNLAITCAAASNPDCMEDLHRNTGTIVVTVVEGIAYAWGPRNPKNLDEVTGVLCRYNGAGSCALCVGMVLMFVVPTRRHGV